MPNTKFIPPTSTALIPEDEVPFEPVVAELVDVDVAPDEVPDAEVDPLLLEVKKVAVGSEETGSQVPPKSINVSSIFFWLKASYLTTCRRVWIVSQVRYLAACSQLNQSACRSTICSELIFYTRSRKRLGSVLLYIIVTKRI